MRFCWLSIPLVAVLIGCGGGASGGNVHVLIRNRGNKPATLFALLPDKRTPGQTEWTNVGTVKPHNDQEFDLPLDKLGPGKNIRLQPGAGAVQIAELNSNTVKSGKVTLTMKLDETMEVTSE